MTIYNAPVEETKFILNEVLNIAKYDNIPNIAEAAGELSDAIINEAGKFAAEVLHPLNEVGDSQGCTRHDDGSVTTPEGFKDAYKMFCDGGWSGLSFPEEFGGQNLPVVVGTAVKEYFSSANMAFGMYPGLTAGNIEAILAHASDELKQKYLPNMVSGTWTGTMNLTEPHCGTDLGLMRTKAVPQDDGSYKITGTKIFISAGEHDMADNIIHLVLAKIQGAPDNIKGVSLFIVPKFMVNEDGSLGERNGVSCGSIEEKMGIHGNATCVLNYEDATGWLVGEENKGMRAMFTMMNEARLGVGLQGLTQSEVSYQNAVVYANDRLQGRALTGEKNPQGPADPIIVHPDVRRMLMDQRSFNEAARALCLEGGLKADIHRSHPDAGEQEKADDFLALLTPVIKGYLTDKAYQYATSAQQVYGGHGYINEHGMSQFVRDARIAMIYEGANGVQALDLVGRKLAMKGGAPLFSWMEEVQANIDALGDDARVAGLKAALAQSLEDMKGGTNWLMENALNNFDHAGAGSNDFMHLMGIVALGNMWAQMAKASLNALENGSGNAKFYETKLKLADYFAKRTMPETVSHLQKIKSGADVVMALEAEDF